MKRPAITLNVTSPFEVDLSRAEQTRTWKTFMKAGTSHSAAAATLPYIIRRCEREGIPYALQAWPGQGYYICKLEKP